MARASTQPAHGPATFADRRPTGIADLGKRAFVALLTWQARISDRAHLRTLDDFMLRDMGLTRTDARQEASKPFWRV